MYANKTKQCIITKTHTQVYAGIHIALTIPCFLLRLSLLVRLGWVCIFT